MCGLHQWPIRAASVLCKTALLACWLDWWPQGRRVVIGLQEWPTGCKLWPLRVRFMIVNIICVFRLHVPLSDSVVLNIFFHDKFILSLVAGRHDIIVYFEESLQSSQPCEETV